MVEASHKMPQKNKILITGSGGMLGTDLSQELGADFGLFGMDIFERQRPEDKNQKYFKCDIADAKEISGLIGDISPSVVVHAAAMTDVDGCEIDKDRAYSINTKGTENVAMACRDRGAKLVYISTDFVFDGKSKRPYRESDKTAPLSVYGDSKLKGEEAVKKTLKDYFILRTSWLYGKAGKNFVDTIVAKAKTEKMLKVVDDQIGSPTHTKDLSKAIHALVDIFFTQYAIRNTQYGTYHISNSGSVSWYEYAKEILRLVGSRAEVRPISSEELNATAKRPAMSVLDNSKFFRLTGYKMRDWNSALREYLG
jgi:dTDP-4-dehydrorhamnose reductase